MSDGMSIRHETFKPNLGEQQSEADALAAIKAAAAELKNHETQWFGKKYLVLRMDEKGTKYLDVQTLTWGEWLASKFGRGGAILPNIIAEFLKNPALKNLENNSHLQSILGKYLEKNIFSLEDASPQEKVSAAKTILAVSETFAFRSKPGYVHSVKKSLQDIPLDVLLPHVKDALKEGHKELAAYLLSLLTSLNNKIQSEEGLITLIALLKLANEQKMANVAKLLVSKITVADTLGETHQELMNKLETEREITLSRDLPPKQALPPPRPAAASNASNSGVAVDSLTVESPLRTRSQTSSSALPPTELPPGSASRLDG